MTDSTSAPRTIRLADYRLPDFLIDTVDLRFDLREDGATVTSRLTMRRNPATSDPAAPLVLDGQGLKLAGVVLDGEALGDNRYSVDAEHLTLPGLPQSFTLEIATEIEPQNNTSLQGLYTSGGNFCTQCEAEGFRHITYYLDRPDILARYTTTIVADKAKVPVLLSNGNPVGAGEAEGGRHWAKWEDPFPKPSYLFALVAGDLVAVEDSFTTRSGRPIDLKIFTRRGDETKVGHAMQSLQASMAWDEQAYGFEYDLDLFMIVAVSDFNMGAMENKGLNIFNTALVLASRETATDGDFQRVESVVAHEYFHNWTGNRITCRDWFQLSLKEGLTVFRDQEFSADLNSRPVQRIADVRRLRAIQFPEDAGPIAHPIRPESYIEINNFYTPTVYEKGAEVIRMIHTLLGPAGYRKGIDLYVERHDGQAATCENFVAAMEDASGVDLKLFRRWYSQAGTPEIAVEEEWADGRYSLTLAQSTAPTPGQPDKQPLHIPVALGLLDGQGRDLPVRLAGEAEAKSGTRVLSLTEARQRFVFEGLAKRPVPSLFRGFSAPVKLAPQPRERLAFLFAHDSDPFNRWEAGQQLAAQLLLEGVATRRAGRDWRLDPDFVAAVGRLLDDPALDAAFVAEAMALPSESFLADQMAMIDVEGIHAVREAARLAIATALRDRLLALYRANDDQGPFDVSAAAVGRRALKNACLAALGLLQGDTEATGLVLAQARTGGTMTDVLAALTVLRDRDIPERTQALEAFYAKWQDEPLVVDKWFALQATSALPGTLDAIKALTRHSAFTLRNPNRARALISSLAMGNPLHFHAADGSGYAFLADQVLALNGPNPQLAARILVPLGRWQRHEPGRRAAMQAELDRILAAPDLSRDVYEIAAKSRA
ncbi:MAG: aminopeptidase N [Inquilinus sp.]|uniref:aminopeptidase N n=1 Tax=Inquilinus sp. TaxID=1932117 RepID=UPI003F39EB81